MKILTRMDITEQEQKVVIDEHRRSTYVLLKQTLGPVFIWPCLCFYFFWGTVDPIIAIIWLISFMVVIGSRHYLVYHWYDEKRPQRDPKLFEQLVLALTFVAACLWGASMLLMDFYQRPAETVFLNIIICALISSSIGIASFWAQYFWAYTFPMLLFYATNFLLGVPDSHFVLFLCAILFGVFLKHTADSFYQKSIDNIILRDRNLQMAEQLSQQITKAEDLAASRSHFLASASHDLRQPLQAMNFYLAALESHVDLKGGQLYQKLEHSTDNMNDLLNSMLDISRLDSDTFKVDIRPFELAPLMQQLASHFEVSAQAKGLQLLLPSGGYRLLSDPILLDRILSNLISNGIKYTEQGQVSLNLEVKDGSLQLTVADTGPGIDSHQQTLIFNEFYQINNPARDRKKGLGLGLSIVKRLCQLLDIELHLDTRPGQGCRFTLKLPLSNGEIEAAGTVENQRSNLSVPLRELSGLRILIIDDEDEVRDSIATLFEQWGCHVFCANSEQQALAQLAPSQPLNFIVSDLRLQGDRNGIELIKLIHSKLQADVPCLIISGDTAAEQLKQVSNSGLTLLHKPIKPMQLRTAVQRLLAETINT